MNALTRAKEDYAQGRIDIDQLEARIAHALEGGETEPRGHDWHDGKGPVHAISLAQHHANMVQMVRRQSRKAL